MTSLDDGRRSVTESPWLTKAEAAAYMRVVPRTIDRWVESGRITRYRVGTQVRFKRAELEQLPHADAPEAQDKPQN